MSGFLAAVLALTWLAILMLAFALAGVIRRINDLTGALAETGGGDPARSPRMVAALRPSEVALRSVVLVVDDACPTCRLVAPAFVSAFRSAPELEPRVLTYTERALAWLGTGGPAVTVDPDAYRALDVPWRPALVLVDADGTVLDARPVGSAESLQRTLEEYRVLDRDRAGRQRALTAHKPSEVHDAQPAPGDGAVSGRTASR